MATAGCRERLLGGAGASAYWTQLGAESVNCPRPEGAAPGLTGSALPHGRKSGPLPLSEPPQRPVLTPTEPAFQHGLGRGLLPNRDYTLPAQDENCEEECQEWTSHGRAHFWYSWQDEEVDQVIQEKRHFRQRKQPGGLL
ncbi:uncharacterized protein isoform X3 [Macaca fascicularis]|uniref:uncharacterized protein isoform X3 n=1 Tax=Macaca fascicularis TaxID=9541 RepID=UPI0032B080ED